MRLAILCTTDAKATTLAKVIDVSPAVIHNAVSRGSCTDDLAKRIELHYGRELFPRELFVPEPTLPSE